MRGFRKLSDYYKYRRVFVKYIDPVIVVICFIAGLVFLVGFPNIWWVGLMFLGLGMFDIILIIIFLKYYNKKIKELEKEEAEKDEQKSKADFMGCFDSSSSDIISSVNIIWWFYGMQSI